MFGKKNIKKAIHMIFYKAKLQLVAQTTGTNGNVRVIYLNSRQLSFLYDINTHTETTIKNKLTRTYPEDMGKLVKFIIHKYLYDLFIPSLVTTCTRQSKVIEFKEGQINLCDSII